MTLRLRTTQIVRVIAALAIAAVFSTPARATNNLVTLWTFEAGTTGNPPAGSGMDITGIAAAIGTGTASGHHASASTAYSNPGGNGSTESFSSDNWAIGDYYQFQTNSTSASGLAFAFDQMGSSTGPKDFQFRYSTDGTNFTDFGSPYAVLSTPGWSGTTGVRNQETYTFDLTGVPTLNNQASVFFRLENTTTASIGGGTVATGGTGRVDNVRLLKNYAVLPAASPMIGDIAFGTSTSGTGSSIELLRGAPVAGGGAQVGDPWSNAIPFLGTVRFDNREGIKHNARGNLLALNFSNGGGANTGAIYDLGTRGTLPVPAPVVIGNTGNVATPIGQDGPNGVVTVSNLSGLSINPANTKVAVTGTGSSTGSNASGKAYVYDYTPGNAQGTGVGPAAAMANSCALEIYSQSSR